MDEPYKEFSKDISWINEYITNNINEKDVECAIDLVFQRRITKIVEARVRQNNRNIEVYIDKAIKKVLLIKE